MMQAINLHSLLTLFYTITVVMSRYCSPVGPKIFTINESPYELEIPNADGVCFGDDGWEISNDQSLALEDLLARSYDSGGGDARGVAGCISKIGDSISQDWMASVQISLDPGYKIGDFNRNFIVKLADSFLAMRYSNGNPRCVMVRIYRGGHNEPRTRVGNIVFDGRVGIDQDFYFQIPSLKTDYDCEMVH